MKSWDQLTEAGKFRRLRPLAAAAIAGYPITPKRISLVGGFANVIFRIDTEEATYALRVDYLQDHTDAHVDVELAWLDALRETDLDVARVVSASSGDLYTYAQTDGVPGPRRCVLFEWIPGRPIADRSTPDRYFQLGELSARLHLHGASFDPPHRPMPWDKVFYWNDDFDPIVHHLSEHAHHFTGGRRQILDRAIETVTSAFGKLDPAKAQVIHADLHPWNVHGYRNRLIALDFEDVAWGDRVQDVAITYFYNRDHPQAAELRTAFEAGYTTVALWPVAYDGQLEHFMAARTIMFINFMLNLREDPSGFFDGAFPRLESFLNDWT